MPDEYHDDGALIAWSHIRARWEPSVQLRAHRSHRARQQPEGLELMAELAGARDQEVSA